MKKNNKLNALIIAVIWYAIYLLYSTVFNDILSMIGITDGTVIMLIADLLFFFGIVFYYRDDIKKSYKEFKENYTIKEKLKIVFLGVLGIFILNILGGVISGLLFQGISDELDDNTEAIYSLADISTIAMVFKTLIFAAVAEELLYKKTVRNVISNDKLFIIVSSLIYAFMNIAYAEMGLSTVVDFIRCFLVSILLSYTYVKQKDNIFIVMLIKFIYTFIPLIMMFTAVGA